MSTCICDSFANDDKRLLGRLQKIDGLADHVCRKDHLGEWLHTRQIAHVLFRHLGSEEIVRQVDVGRPWGAIHRHADGTLNDDRDVLDAGGTRCVLRHGLRTCELVELLEAALTFQ